MQKLACFLLFLVSVPLAAQTIRGRVTAEGTPLPGVTVSIDELHLTTVTDAQGNYALKLPTSHRPTLRVSAALQGFQSKSATVTATADATQDFALKPSFGTEITVGSRAINAQAEKAVPVDVIPRQQIESSPSTETNQIIEKIAPSFNFPRPSLSDGTDSVRPATLRGLGPDQVLVMVNGKRQHVSALVNVNGTIGRGSSGVDLNAIPSSAIDSVEILRDGAAAQYGSDAIAGVLNVIFKSDPQPLRIDVKGGSTTHGDGATFDTNLTGGWALGRGTVFAAAEYRDRHPTNRALNDPRDQVKTGDAGNNAVAQPNTHWGDAYERDLLSAVNLNVPVSEDGRQIAYAFGTFDIRHGSHGGNYRRALDATDWPQIYPLGYLPLIEPRIMDDSLNAGLRGQAASWFYDASLVYGRNKFDFYVRHSLNVSLGP
ncbi:MAG TPA: TonB-dependent receptor plug domain-containing protein, partial [Thermoanaerobaculia bacterium]